jgi:hypothetical protein
MTHLQTADHISSVLMGATISFLPVPLAAAKHSLNPYHPIVGIYVGLGYCWVEHLNSVIPARKILSVGDVDKAHQDIVRRESKRLGDTLMMATAGLNSRVRYRYRGRDLALSSSKPRLNYTLTKNDEFTLVAANRGLKIMISDAYGESRKKLEFALDSRQILQLINNSKRLGN